MNKWRNIEWHWTNDNEKTGPDGSKQLGSPLKHGRAWFCHNLSKKKRTRTVMFEWVLWTHFWHAYISCDENDEQVHFSIGCGLFALWIGLGNIVPYWMLPTRMVQGTQDKPFEMIQNRKIGISYLIGTFTLSLWEDPTAWSSTDPWWWSIGFNPFDFFLGRAKFSTVELHDKLVTLPLPEQNYIVHCHLKQQVKKRPRWFSKRENYGTISCDNGIPMPGKNGTDLQKEISQNGSTYEQVISNTVEYVLRKRQQRWGQHEPR